MRVLLLDGNDFFRTGLSMMLADRGFEMAEAKAGEDALRDVHQFQPHVTLMDVQPADASGTELAARLIENAPGSAVIMLSAAANEDQVVAAVRAGASGYLLKDAATDEIVAAIRAVSAGESWIAPPAASVLMAHVRASDPQPAARHLPMLSLREHEVLALIVRGRDNAEIADRLYLSASTVKNHVSTLLAKLGVENRVQAAVYALATRRPEPRRSPRPPEPAPRSSGRRWSEQCRGFRAAGDPELAKQR